MMNKKIFWGIAKMCIVTEPKSKKSLHEEEEEEGRKRFSLSEQFCDIKKNTHRFDKVGRTILHFALTQSH